MYLQAKSYDKAIAQLKQIGDAGGDVYLAANALLTERTRWNFPAKRPTPPQNFRSWRRRPPLRRRSGPRRATPPGGCS
jgi:hypothetical protein